MSVLYARAHIQLFVHFANIETTITAVPSLHLHRRHSGTIRISQVCHILQSSSIILTRVLPCQPIHALLKENPWTPVFLLNPDLPPTTGHHSPTVPHSSLQSLYSKRWKIQKMISTTCFAFCLQRMLYTAMRTPPPFFDNATDLLQTVDSIPFGDIPWYSFAVRYTGEVDDNSPAWKRATYVVHARNTLHVAEAMASSTDFNGSFDTVPFEEYVGKPGEQTRRLSNLMSGQWAYTKAVSSRFTA